jgi:hypothetical protein
MHIKFRWTLKYKHTHSHTSTDTGTHTCTHIHTTPHSPQCHAYRISDKPLGSHWDAFTSPKGPPKSRPSSARAGGLFNTSPYATSIATTTCPKAISTEKVPTNYTSPEMPPGHTTPSHPHTACCAPATPHPQTPSHAHAQPLLQHSTSSPPAPLHSSSLCKDGVQHGGDDDAGCDDEGAASEGVHVKKAPAGGGRLGSQAAAAQLVQQQLQRESVQREEMGQPRWQRRQVQGADQIGAGERRQGVQSTGQGAGGESKQGAEGAWASQQEAGAVEAVGEHHGAAPPKWVPLTRAGIEASFLTRLQRAASTKA